MTLFERMINGRAVRAKDRTGLRDWLQKRKMKKRYICPTTTYIHSFRLSYECNLLFSSAEDLFVLNVQEEGA